MHDVALLLVHLLDLLDLSGSVGIPGVNVGKGGLDATIIAAHPVLARGDAADGEQEQEYAEEISPSRVFLLEVVLGQEAQFIGSTHGTRPRWGLISVLAVLRGHGCTHAQADR